jgi:carboxyl-terminal processing protease
VVVDSLMRGLDEKGRYVYSDDAGVANDGRILTSVGIEGARDSKGNFRVLGVYRGSPADNAGIVSDDLIAEINGTLVSDIDDSVLASMMSGFNSGTLKMTILSPSGTRRVVVRRATIVSADADVVFMDDDNGGILEIIVNRVSNGAVAIVSEALAKHPNLSGIILDLRAADGDDERAAAKLAGLFIGAKPVMRIIQNEREELEVIPSGAAVTNAPVVVVVSNTTRGTAEAIAAAFYENMRGVLIGTPTAGAARIASKISLSDGGMLELLNKSVKTGRGMNLDNRGIFPLVCLSNIRTSSQQDAFFLNVINNDFRARDFNGETNVDAESVRNGCPTITSGEDEDLVAMSVAVKILTDPKVYSRLVNFE